MPRWSSWRSRTPWRNAGRSGDHRTVAEASPTWQTGHNQPPAQDGSVRPVGSSVSWWSPNPASRGAQLDSGRPPAHSPGRSDRVPSQPSGRRIDDADTIKSARGIVRGQPPGRYDVDEIRAESIRT